MRYNVAEVNERVLATAKATLKAAVIELRAQGYGEAATIICCHPCNELEVDNTTVTCGVCRKVISTG
jgi:hypothetical protein